MPVTPSANYSANYYQLGQGSVRRNPLPPPPPLPVYAPPSTSRTVRGTSGPALPAAGPASPAMVLPPRTETQEPTSEFLQQLIASLPDTTTTTVNQQSNRSPELEAQIQESIDQQNTLRGDMQTAYQGKLASYDDVIQALANTYGKQSGAQSSAASTAALNSGFTPLEATQQGSDALNNVLQLYAPQLANVKSQQADVPIAATEAQRGVSQDFQALLAQVIAPYRQSVAGQTQTSVTEDPARRVAMLQQLMQSQSNIATQERGQDIGAMTAQAQIRQRQEEVQVQAMMQGMKIESEQNIAQLREMGMDDRLSMEMAGRIQIAKLQKAGMEAKAAQNLVATLQKTEAAQRAAMQKALLPYQLTTADQKSRSATDLYKHGNVSASDALPYQGTTAAQRLPYQLSTTGDRLDAESARNRLTFDQYKIQQAAAEKNFLQLQKDKVVGPRPMDPNSGIGLQYTEFQDTPWGSYPVLASEKFGPGVKRGAKDTLTIRPWAAGTNDKSGSPSATKGKGGTTLSAADAAAARSALGR